MGTGILKYVCSVLCISTQLVVALPVYFLIKYWAVFFFFRYRGGMYVSRNAVLGVGGIKKFKKRKISSPALPLLLYT